MVELTERVTEKKLPKRRLVWAGIGVAGVILVGIVVAVIDLSTHSSATNQVSVALKAAEQTTTVPLYAPSTIPTGWQYEPQSLSTGGNVTIMKFSSAGGQQLVVNQQARPATTEDVNKTVEFDTPAGHAYIADLEGQVVGFLRTDKSLIIITGATKDQADFLRQFITSFKPV